MNNFEIIAKARKRDITEDSFAIYCEDDDALVKVLAKLEGLGCYWLNGTKATLYKPLADCLPYVICTNGYTLTWNIPGGTSSYFHTQINATDFLAQF